MVLTQLLTLVQAANITANQFFLLYSKRSNIPFKQTKADVLYLKSINFLDENGDITPIGNIVLDNIVKGVTKKDKPKKEVPPDLKENINKYLKLWPNIRLPSGKLAISDEQNLIRVFTWFLNTYDYSWEVIFKATYLYISEYAEKDYKFMRTSQFFVMKTDVNKIISSELANYCQMVVNGDIEEKINKFKDNVT